METGCQYEQSIAAEKQVNRIIFRSRVWDSIINERKNCQKSVAIIVLESDVN